MLIKSTLWLTLVEFIHLVSEMELSGETYGNDKQLEGGFDLCSRLFTSSGVQILEFE